MSPRDEAPGKLASFLFNLPSNVDRLVDPQVHIGSVWPVRDGHLKDYPHYRQNLTPSSFTLAVIHRFVNDTLQWQSQLNVSAIVSPTVTISTFGSQWEQISWMLAQQTIAAHDGSKPLLISLVVEENALRQRKAVDAWLNNLTKLDVEGFYLVVLRGSDIYRQHFDPESLSSLLRICHSLSHVNEYRVVVGYTDMLTLLLHAVGVEATGAGWYTGLKQFTLRRFTPSTGGRRARPRYSSLPLLNSIYVTELDAIYNGGNVGAVLSGTVFDGKFGRNTNPENVPWPDYDAALHHWAVLSQISQSPSGTTVSRRLDSVRSLIGQAMAVYGQVGGFVPFTTETGQTHLQQWLSALNSFRSDAAV